MTPREAATVFLDSGVDEALLDSGDMVLDGSVIRMLLPWRFDEGSCLEITLNSPGDSGPVDVEAMVVDTRESDARPHRFETLLLVLSASGDGNPVPTQPEKSLCAIL